MAEGLNRATLLGNLGTDPELKHLQNGNAVLTLRLATTQGFLDRNRVRQERTEWHSVTVWGRRAEALAKFLSKGDRVCIEGEIRTRSWEGPDGTKRYKTEINAQRVILCGGSQQRSSNEPPPEDDYAPPAQNGYDDGDDIPF